MLNRGLCENTLSTCVVTKMQTYVIAYRFKHFFHVADGFHVLINILALHIFKKYIRLTLCSGEMGEQLQFTFLKYKYLLFIIHN